MAAIPLTLDSPMATPSGRDSEAHDRRRSRAAGQLHDLGAGRRRPARRPLAPAAALGRRVPAAPPRSSSHCGQSRACWTRGSAGARRATVRWDAAQTRVSGLVAAIRRAGYGAVPDAAAGAGASPATAHAVAPVRRRLLHDAGDDVPGAALRGAPGKLPRGPAHLLLWAAWLLSIPVVLFSAAPFFRGAWAGPAAAAHRHGRAGGDRHRGRLRRQQRRDLRPRGLFGDEAYFDSLTMFVSFLLVGR